MAVQIRFILTTCLGERIIWVCVPHRSFHPFLWRSADGSAKSFYLVRGDLMGWGRTYNFRVIPFSALAVNWGQNSGVHTHVSPSEVVQGQGGKPKYSRYSERGVTRVRFFLTNSSILSVNILLTFIPVLSHAIREVSITAHSVLFVKSLFPMTFCVLISSRQFSTVKMMMGVSRKM